MGLIWFSILDVSFWLRLSRAALTLPILVIASVQRLASTSCAGDKRRRPSLQHIHFIAFYNIERSAKSTRLSISMLLHSHPFALRLFFE